MDGGPESLHERTTTILKKCAFFCCYDPLYFEPIYSGRRIALAHSLAK